MPSPVSGSMAQMSFLAAIYDISLPSSIIDHFLLFCNAFQSLEFSSQIEILSNTGHLLTDNNQTLVKPSNYYKQFWVLNQSFKNNYEHLPEEKRCFSSSLSQALCLCNKSSLASRILILSGTNDAANEYISIMNSIFTAQKLGIVIDVLVYGTDISAPFLQQAAFITGGVYLNTADSSSVVHYLTHAVLPNPDHRKLVKVSSQEGVCEFLIQADFRAVCFCHKNVVTVGWVCSVCLSIVCFESKKCIMCKASF